MKIDYIPYLRKMCGHSLVISIGLTCMIIDKEKELVLLEKRKDNGLYCFPGGSIDLGEEVLDGVKRECYEETGIKLDELTLFMIRSGEKTRIKYPNGDETEYLDLVFLSYVDSDKVIFNPHDDESTRIEFVPFSHFPEPQYCLKGAAAAFNKYMKGDFKVTIDEVKYEF